MNLIAHRGARTMLELEFTHAAAAGTSTATSFLSEFRLPMHGRSQGLRRATGGIWLFGFADAERDATDSALDILAREFRAAPASESAGVTFSRLFQEAKLQPGLPVRPHSGVVACGLCFDRVVVAHSGGTGCYLVRQNHATRLTLSNVDLIDYQIQPGDVLLLCGEAMHHAVKGSEMAEIVGHGADLKAAARQLSELATEREPEQAISVAVIRILAVERSSQIRSRAQATF